MIDDIFVFGSNLAGRHGAGAALWAKRYRGATYGQGVGLQGQSYAIPTKDDYLKTLSLHTILLHVCDFIRFAAEHPEMRFQVTPIGCGLAGLKPEQIAPMFNKAPPNVTLPIEFVAILIGADFST